MLVLFGPLPPGEVVVELLRGRPRSAFRRLRRGAVHARLGGGDFTVRYHAAARYPARSRPGSGWSARGIGVFVPPSGAEPGISAHPRLLRALERLDRLASAPLAVLGDHVAYVLRRTGARCRRARRPIR